MSEPESRKELTQPALTATVSTMFVALCSLLPEEVFTSNGKQAVLIFSTLLTPFLVSFLIRLHSRVDIPPELVSYISCLDRDFKNQAKGLKSKTLSDEVRLELQRQQSETIMKRGTVFQDYACGKLDLTNLKRI